MRLADHPLFLEEEDDPKKKDYTIEQIKLGKIIDGRIVWAPDTYPADQMTSHRAIADVWGGGEYCVRALGHVPKRANQTIVATIPRLSIDGVSKTPKWAAPSAPEPSAPAAPSGGGYLDTLKSLAPALGPIAITAVVSYLERKDKREADADQARAAATAQAAQQNQAFMSMMLSVMNGSQQAGAAQQAAMLQLVQQQTQGGRGNEAIELGLKLAGLMTAASTKGAEINWADTLKELAGVIVPVAGAVTEIAKADQAKAKAGGLALPDAPTEDGSYETHEGTDAPREAAPLN